MRNLVSLLLLTSALGSCSSRGGDRPAAAPAAFAPGSLPPSNLSLEEAVLPGPSDTLLVGAGDIARCADLADATTTGDLVRDLLRKHPTAQVFTAGDNAYADTPEREFQDACYEKTWGSFKRRTAPTPGNHEYGKDATAAPYFAYFPYYTAHADAKKGRYSFNLGWWHIVSLNSDPHGLPLADQADWLDKDLAASKQPCTLAIWHHPLFSSGDEHGGDSGDPGRRTGIFWEVLKKHHADVILNGHDHNYERFAPQDTSKNPDPLGPRQFVAGTGGGDLRGLLSKPAKNSEAQLIQVPGVLVLTLKPNSYAWAFVGKGSKVYDPSPEPVTCYDKP